MIMKRANQVRITLLFLLALVRKSFPFLLPLPSSYWVTTTSKTSRWFDGPPAINSDDDSDSQVDQKLIAPSIYGSIGIVSDTKIIEEVENDDNDDEYNNNNNDDEDVISELFPVCRIVTRAGSVIKPSIVPTNLYHGPYLFDKLDAYYHAQARKIMQKIPYMRYGSNSNEQSKLQTNKRNTIEDQKAIEVDSMDTNRHSTLDKSKEIDDKSEPYISVLQQNLEDSGFELLSKRDIDLCESLNVGYLLRLSISPDVKELDPIISKEFYPERFGNNSTYIKEIEEIEDLLFDGRILVYWRGYSQEVTKGQRLLLQKFDYLQASLVQRAAARLMNRLDRVESNIFRSFRSNTRLLRRNTQTALMWISEKLQIQQFARWIDSIISDEIKVDYEVGVSEMDFSNEENKGTHINDRSVPNSKNRGIFKFDRYGGSKVRSVGSPDPTDALDPFTICENYYDKKDIQSKGNRQIATNFSDAVSENNMYEEVYNNNAYTCAYDGRQGGNDKELPRMQLLERVSISNLVDIFTNVGRRGLLKTFFARSKLVEPTYEEVVVIWRPLLKQKKKIGPPKIVSEFADMFDIEGFEQPKEKESKIQKEKLQIRLFEQVPMSNLQAVLPKTKLVFRPADAFIFDTITFGTFIIVCSSIRFDSYRLDLLALISFTFWLLRTLFRYSNKLARYDLLVKTFLTSKISQRNAGAFQYLAYEAGSQRAIRAALVHQCMLNAYNKVDYQYKKESESSFLTKSILEQSCEIQVNQLLNTENEVKLNAKRAIEDLQDLRLLSFSENEDRLIMVKDTEDAIKQLWMELLDNEQISSAIDSTPLAEVDIIDDENDVDSDFVDSIKTTDVSMLRSGDWQERRAALTHVLDKNVRTGILKAKEFLRNRANERNRTLRNSSRQIEDTE